LKNKITGEFIEGILDGELNWSGDQYDVVTAFDVLEHLYDPIKAFKNLNMLVKKDGCLIVETGDAGSYWPNHFGIEKWWYVNLFEHHIFWTKSAIEIIANQNGFDIIRITNKRHKSKYILPVTALLKDMFKTLLYFLSPSMCERKAQGEGRELYQPRSPFSKDHLLVVMKKR